MRPQAFCENEACRVFSWDMRDTREQFEATARIVKFGEQPGK